jgi:shikimate kinase/3-dehydroquinate synthase
MAERIRVNAPGGEDYDIVIEAGLLSDSQRLVGDFELGKRVAIITNDTVGPLYGSALVSRLPDAVMLTMPDGEAYKTMETVTDLCRQCAQAGLDRGSTIIALGGGVVGDTAGYVAASYMRGIRLVQAPTSLLAMVDSSVGGKVGVDIPEGKNLVGAFKQPAAVLIDPDVLATLPQVEWRNGMAETIKHGFIADPALLDTDLHALNRAAEMVRRAVQVKVNVVEEDPYEQGIRQFLNLGHTFGHAIERVTQYEWAHGHGVGFGVVAAAALSHRLGMIDADLNKQIRDAVTAVGLPTKLGNIAPSDLWEAMRTDKKWRDGRSRFVLLKALAQPTVVEDVPKEDVIAVLDSLR